MQIFVPFDNPFDCAKALYHDKKRFNNQTNECSQIIKAITGLSNAWKNHPVVKMYYDHVDWLKLYTSILITYNNYIKANSLYYKELLYNSILNMNNKAEKIKPYFLNKEFCDNNKKRLFTKNPKAFYFFESFGESFENWYYVNGKKLIYVQ